MMVHTGIALAGRRRIKSQNHTEPEALLAAAQERSVGHPERINGKRYEESLSSRPFRRNER